MTRTFVVLAAMVWASVASAQSTGERLTLDRAVALAIEHNRTLDNAAIDEQKAEEDLATARTYRLPQFGLDAQVAQLLRPIDVQFKQGAFGTFPGIGPVPATDTNITTGMTPTMMIQGKASQPLTQLFRLNLNVRLNEATRDVSREQLRAGRLEIVNTVKRQYYAILQTESAIDSTDHTIRLLREVNRTADERLLRQVVLKNDVLASNVRLAEAEHSMLTLQNALASQKEQLNQLMGRDVRTSFETDGPPLPVIAEINHEAAVNEALESRPDLRQARIRLQQAELGRRIARTDYIPDVSLAVSYLSPINIEGAPRQIATAGIQLQWEPFDWGRRGRAVAAKDLEVRKARNGVRDAEDKVVLEINTAHRHIEEARSRLKLAAMAQESARETVRIRANQFRAQSALLSDVLNAEATMADANDDYQQALLALWQADADYERALGQEVTK